MTTEIATKDASAAQDAINNLQKEIFLDNLRDQGLVGVTLLSFKMKVNRFLVDQVGEDLALFGRCA